MIGWLFGIALLASVAFVLWKGGWEERAVAATLFAGSLGTLVIFMAHGRDFIAAHGALLANEAAILAVYLFVAFRSKRFWPLFAAGFQVPAVLALLTPVFGTNVLSYGLGVAQGLWAYLQLAVVVLATIRHAASTKRRSLPD